MRHQLRFLLVACAVLALDRGTGAAERIELEVQETAGIQRFGYSVNGLARLPEGVTDETPFRLLASEQWGAATSPQTMLAPPTVRAVEPCRRQGSR